jgi:hypothetical protein
MICASAPAVKGIFVAGLNRLLGKFGKKRREPSFPDHEFVGYARNDIEKISPIVSVQSVQKYEY